MKKHWVLLCIGFAAAGFGFGVLVPSPASLLPASTCNEEPHAFLNPRLRCISDPERKREYAMFKEHLVSYIGRKTGEGSAESVSVYFRDLENGPTFGVDEDALFSPASLFKLPVLVAYFKKAEQDPALLSRTIRIGDEETRIEDLLVRMVVDSDNDVLHALIDYAESEYSDDNIYADTLAEIGIAQSEESPEDFITVKRYASIYRMLYNASFLNKEMSERVLEILTNTKSIPGIDDGIPPGIPVAHKFGLREKDGFVQLHDCGVVYYPENHYLLCVMTKGQSWPRLSAIIREIASMMHEEVVSRNTQN